LEGSFEIELSWLQNWLRDLEVDFLYILQQTKLADNSDEAWLQVWEKNKGVLALGGEGLILRSSTQEWTPKRLSTVLKVKPSYDAEAIVIGSTSGRTGKTGRYLGMMGNLIVDYNGTRFELSGFNNEEREINDPVLKAWCVDNPGKEMPNELISEGSLYFNLGDQLTFLYRELSKDQVPKDARFFRSRPQE
jgi:ATP-dependent DNA ligase